MNGPKGEKSVNYLKTDEIKDQLRQIKHPGLTRDIVSSGFIKGITTDGPTVTVEFAPNTNNQEKVEQMEREIRDVLYGGNFVDVHIHTKPPFDEDSMLLGGATLNPLQAEMLEDGVTPEADPLQGGIPARAPRCLARKPVVAAALANCVRIAASTDHFSDGGIMNKKKIGTGLAIAGFVGLAFASGPARADFVVSGDIMGEICADGACAAKTIDEIKGGDVRTLRKGGKFKDVTEYNVETGMCRIELGEEAGIIAARTVFMQVQHDGAEVVLALNFINFSCTVEE